MSMLKVLGSGTLLSFALSPLAHSQALPAGPATSTTSASPAAQTEAADASSLNLPDIIIREKAQERGYQPKRASTATRSDAALLETPQSVGVVPAQVMQDQLIRNIDEAMYNISGVTQANTLGGTQDALIKRGFGFNRDGSILRDGIRTVLARNLTYTTERVEVLKGPSSIMYGTMDPGGVVNMVTKKPQLTTQAQVALTASDLGGGASVDLTGAIGSSGLAYRLIADYSNSDYWRNFGDSRQLVVAPSLAWYGRDNTVRISYEHTNYEQPFDRGTVIDNRTGKPVNIPRDERLDEAYNRSIGDSDFFTVQSQHKLNQQWTANFAYSYNRNRYDDFQARTVSLNPVTGVLTRRPDGTRGAVSQEHAVQSDITGKLKLGEIRHDVMLGFDFEDSNIYRRDLIRGTNNTSFNIYKPVYGLLPNSTTISAPDSDQTDKLHAYSLFAQDTVHLSEQWIAQAGVRYQQYDEVAGKGRPFNINTDVSGNKLIPRVGVVYLLNPAVSLYSSYSESFKPNTSIASHIDALPPEQGKSWEVGAKLDLPKGITATAALYNIDKQNVQVSEVVNGDTFVRAAGKARSQGLELDVAGEIAPQWKLIGSYAYTDAKVTQDPKLQGNRLANVARQSASVFITHDFDRSANRDQWRAGAGVRYVGSRAGDSANSFFLDPYHVVDAFASYDTTLAGHSAHLQLNIRNLLDKTYYPSAGSNIYVAVGDARQFILRGIIDF
ncbi:TonB-dependent siderophore receptor [Undibacterium terreum]|uniref:TonB-dependent receptor n=1 Tax=Undibacterium terreum TaxID=1224302 RepID=A0A916XR07_9BURK|nr:TonB-dependent siderophore receptor [Undibacterium terreum]GGC97584.1 TonB-dependent receptor [Undibacterium terreum]